MHEKNLFPICKRFSIFSALPSKSNPLVPRNLTNSAPNHVDSDGFSPNLVGNFAGQFSSMLQEFSNPPGLQKGRQVHAQVVVNGFSDMGFLATRILGMYVLCRSFEDAKSVFSRVEKWYPLPWNWMIRGFTMMGCFEFALLFYFKMLGGGVSPDRYTFPYVIKGCSGLNAVKLGRLIHESIHLMGLDTDVFVASSLIKMYAENDAIDDARRLFDRMIERDSVLWNVMVNGFVTNGDANEALGLFCTMRKSETRPNSVTFACVLSVCASEGKIDYGIQLHGLVIKCGLDMDASVANTLLAMYSKCGRLPDARKLFDIMGQVDLVTWNGMIAGCVQNGFSGEALDLFYEMQSAGVKPDSITFSSFLPSFSVSAGLKQGKEIHGYIVRNGICLDAFLKSALIDIYFKCRDVNMARKVFDRTGTVDIVICSAMISGFVLNGLSDDALGMFRWLLRAQMKPNAVTLASVLPACSCLAALRLGKELHCYILKNAFDGRCYVGSALTDMYAKCGRLDLGSRVFENMFDRDAVLWNTMISSYSQNGQPEEAIHLFRQMGLEGMRCDCVTISAALSACANIPALIHGKAIHGFMMKGALRSDLFAKSALIDMYAKCGDLVFARRVFDYMQEKNEVSWNSIIAAYGTHGLVRDALGLFREMKEAGIRPDHITFLAIISSCGHSGLVDEGFKYFRCMIEECGIVARMEHYACMVDLFGRSGRLYEALDFITSMPFKPDAGIWGALLGACRVHRNVELAELASKHLFELDPQNSGYYVLMSNIHAVAGKWEGVLKVRSLMKERGVQKLPGCSWIEINSTTHMFIAADRSHPQSAQIYLFLKCLLLELREAGYVPKPDLMYPIPMESDD
ncbi:pentatricopeptide repeat-containing protein At4g21300 [Magnolia sinica]|uniref:pentatricopeptide repeat-containing protein At4g21300 n=1 Tax=Magnolia sinica TaxID=86752 RepID=UPI002658B375|nr:pentatricopeptide repeat-containing protein At4g21300 [Magnolia sinica]